MNPFRIAPANLRFPTTPEESVTLAEQAIAQASRERAGLICFPECFVSGYRGMGKPVPPPTWHFLNALLITALIIHRDGTIAGFQDKVQLDPSEDGIYAPGSGRRVFQTGPLTSGVVICHEGWRYPETVRWAVRHGAHIVFHPHFHEGEPSGYQPSSFADPANSFHEKAALCRAAENTCYFATINCASAGSPTTSAVVQPDRTLLRYQLYGKQGLRFCREVYFQTEPSSFVSVERSYWRAFHAMAVAEFGAKIKLRNRNLHGRTAGHPRV